MNNIHEKQLNDIFSTLLMSKCNDKIYLVFDSSCDGKSLVFCLKFKETRVANSSDVSNGAYNQYCGGDEYWERLTNE